MKITVAALGVVLGCISTLTACPIYAQDEGNCERALKQLREKKTKNTKTLPYVCPKELGAQLQTVLARIKDKTANGYKFDKAVLHMETGSTTELDVGLNLVVFTISYKGKKGLTQSLETQFTSDDKKALEQQLAQFESLGFVGMTEAAQTKQKSAEDRLRDALNDAIEIASQVSVLPNTSVVAKLQFSVSNEVDAGVSFIIYGSSKASAGLNFTKASVNSIEITLKKNKT
jgi:hypothetical protein